jgi:hypothetical protein
VSKVVVVCFLPSLDGTVTYLYLSLSSSSSSLLDSYVTPFNSSSRRFYVYPFLPLLLLLLLLPTSLQNKKRLAINTIQLQRVQGVRELFFVHLL